MKAFNLKDALAGAPVRTRDGRKAYVRHHESELELDESERISGYVCTDQGVQFYTWSCIGTFRTSGVRGAGADIVGMFEPEFKHWDLFDPCIEKLQICKSLISGSGVFLEASTRKGLSFRVHLARNYITDPVGTVYTR